MIVVTGATGNVARPLVRALAEAGEPVTAVSRGRIPAETPDGAGHVGVTWPRRRHCGPALEGAEALFLHDGGAGGHGLDPAAILDMAKAAGYVGWCCSARKAW